MDLRHIAILVILICTPVSLAEDDLATYWYAKGQESLNNSSYEKAIDSFDRSIAEDRDNWDAWYGKGKALIGIENFDDGLALCDEVLGNPYGPQGERLAQFLALDGYFNKAYEDKYGKPTMTNPETGASSNDMPERYQLAMERYDEALNLDPNMTSAWNGKGIAFGDAGQFDESIKCFDRALSIDRTLAEVFNNKGVSLDRQRKNDESLACYDRAIELNPGLAQAWMNRARTLSLNLSLFSMAQQNACRAVELDPSLENETSLLTWSYIQLF